jgi:hypothetical protein
MNDDQLAIQLEVLTNLAPMVLMQELCSRLLTNDYPTLKLDKWVPFTYCSESYAIKIINLNDVNRKE